ncbi:MAG TPA: TolC family protein [Lacunisphaera sp.]|nr:TolC family protein [Lacunisphaera sp.]
MSQASIRSYFSIVAIVGATIGLGWSQLEAQPVPSVPPVPLAEDIFPQLKPILAKALTQSPQMLQRNVDIAQAEALKIQTRASLLPSLSSGVSYATSTAAVSSNTNVSSQASGIYYSVSLGQPIFHWGALKAGLDSAKIGVEIAKKNFAEAYRLLAVSIRQQYVGLIIGKVNLRNAEFALTLSRSNLAIEEERLRNGRISPGGILPPRLAVEEAELNRDRARASLDQSIQAFCLLTGLDTLDPALLPDEITLGGLYFDTSFTQSLVKRFLSTEAENTPQAQVYRDYIRQANLTYKINKYRLFPMIGLSASYSLSNSTSASLGLVSQVGVTSQSVYVTASWSIFDGMATRGAKRSSLLTKRTYELTLENYLRSNEVAVQNLRNQLDFAARAMKLADTRRDIQHNSLKLVEQDLARGVGSKVNADAARAVTYQADLTAYAARADFLARWADLLSAIDLDPALQNLPVRYLDHAK